MKRHDTGREGVPAGKPILLATVVLAWCHRDLAGDTRRECRRRLEQALGAVMVLAPTQRDSRRLRRRYGRIRFHLSTSDHPEMPAGNNDDYRRHGDDPSALALL